jgi:dTDP-L-rhamnose 4-epimerase
MKDVILITGGAGFIGSRTANTLCRKGHSVRVLDNLNRQVHPNPRDSLSFLDPRVEFVCGDIRDPAMVESALDGVGVVFHLAANTGVGQSMYQIARYCDVTIQGTAVLAECLVKSLKKVKRVVLASSRAVYGEGLYRCVECGDVQPATRTLAELQAAKWDLVCPKCSGEIAALPCPESTARRPVSIYGLTKQVQEDLLGQVSRAYNVPLTILRYFNVFGAGQSISNPYTGVLSIFCSLLLAERDLDIYEDGRMQRDFVSVNDVVTANIAALHLSNPGVEVFNVGSGVSRTILEVAELLRRVSRSASHIEVSGRYRIGDIRHCFAEMTRTNMCLPMEANGSFDDALSELVAWAAGQELSVSPEASLAELSNHGLGGVATRSA